MTSEHRPDIPSNEIVGLDAEGAFAHVQVDRVPTLLAPATLLLRAHGYRAEADTVPTGLPAVPTLPFLLAENDYFAIGITEFFSPQELPVIAAAAANALVERIATDAGAKRWDFYLVLVSSVHPDDVVMPESVTTIVYNTTFFRRVVKWGIEPSELSISEALRAFLPLAATGVAAPVSPMQRLTERLPSYGLSPELAAQTMERFRFSRRHGA